MYGLISYADVPRVIMAANGTTVGFENPKRNFERYDCHKLNKR